MISFHSYSFQAKILTSRYLLSSGHITCDLLANAGIVYNSIVEGKLRAFAECFSSSFLPIYPTPLVVVAILLEAPLPKSALVCSFTELNQPRQIGKELEEETRT
jgi:hypothetical protein